MDVMWAIKLLGGLRVAGEGRTIDRFRTHKTASLLAYLAYYHHRAHPRELLVEMFWPESDLNAGRQSLSMALSSLRQQLEPPGAATGSVIVADRSSVALNPAAVQVDTACFEGGLELAAASTNDSEKVQRLIDALEWYSGELLPGFYDEWVVPEQQRLESRFVEAGSALIRLLESRDERDAAAGWAHRMAVLAPLSDFDRDASGRLEALLTDPITSAVSTSTPPAVMSVPPGLGMDRPRARRTPPAGTVTFLLADIDKASGTAARSALLDGVLAEIGPVIRSHGGWEIGTPNEPLLFAFAHASSAASAALTYQQMHSAVPEAEGPLPRQNLRIALDTGEAEIKGGRYQGAVLQSLARLLMAARGGQIVCSETTASIVQRGQEPGVQFQDLGSYRLGSIRLGVPQSGSPLAAESATRVFQVEQPGSPPDESQRLNARPFYSGNIPLQFTRFFGRVDELERLGDILRPARSTSLASSGKDFPEPAGHRLVTLTGPGGTGKTRLALEAASRFAPKFFGATWFVSLAEVEDPDAIPGAILQALRIPNAPAVETLEQVIDALLGINGDPVLLVLDNFEQLLDEGTAVIQRLLEHAPRLTCLVTSRRRLGIDAELEFPLSPLKTPLAASAPDELATIASVQLFVDRAQAVRPDFQITRANASAIGELCRKLEGMPLSLELAASRAQVLTPAQILQQLSHRLDFLATRRTDRPPRHRTLRAAIDWSYHLLDPVLQQTFTRLAIFHGSWTLEAAEAICSTPDGATERSRGGATEILASLEDCSLITVEDVGGSIRFRMLEMLREYADEHLDPEERFRLAARHAAFYATFAEEAQPNLWGPDQSDWYGAVEREHDNLRASLAWASENSPETALRLVATLGEFWEVRGYWNEGRSWSEKVLNNRGAEAGTALELSLCTAAGFAALQGDYDHAAALLEQALVLAQQNSHRPEEALALRKTAEVAFYRGNYDHARSLLERSEAINRELGSVRGVALCLLLLGKIASHHQDVARSRALWSESLEIGRQLGEKRCIAMSLDHLVNMAVNDRQYQTASDYQEESLVIRREIGDRAGVAASLSNLGWISYFRGDAETVRSLWEESLGIHRELGDKPGVAYCVLCLAYLSGRLDDPAAEQLYEESLGILRGVGYRWQISQALQGLAGVLHHHGEYAAAIRHLDESLAITRDLGVLPQQANVLRALSINAHTQGNFALARRFSEECVAIRRSLGEPCAIAQGLFHLGSDLCGLGDFPHAAACLVEALDIYVEYPDLKGAAYVLEAIARLENTTGNHERAAVLFGAVEWLCESIELDAPLSRHGHDLQMTLLSSEFPEWQASWDKGKGLELENIIALARESNLRAIETPLQKGCRSAESPSGL